MVDARHARAESRVRGAGRRCAACGGSARVCGRVRRVRVCLYTVAWRVCACGARDRTGSRLVMVTVCRVCGAPRAALHAARGVVCWYLESALPLVVWVAWCGACGAQMAVWVSTALCISRYTDQTSGDREGESLALVSSIAHRPGHRFPFRTETRKAL